MIYNSRPEGNFVFHIRTDPETGKKPIANLPFAWSNEELLCGLMESDNLEVLKVASPDDSTYLFVLSQNHTRPYPSVMILRVIYEGSNIRIIDVEKQDLQAAYYAIENFLS